MEEQRQRWAEWLGDAEFWWWQVSFLKRITGVWKDRSVMMEKDWYKSVNAAKERTTYGVKKEEKRGSPDRWAQGGLWNVDRPGLPLLPFLPRWLFHDWWGENGCVCASAPCNFWKKCSNIHSNLYFGGSLCIAPKATMPLTVFRGSDVGCQCNASTPVSNLQLLLGEGRGCQV